MILGVEDCSGSLVCGATFLNIPNARDPLTFWAGFFPQPQKLRRRAGVAGSSVAGALLVGWLLVAAAHAPLLSNLVAQALRAVA